MKVNPARAERYRREHAEYLSRMRKGTARPHADRSTRIRLAVGLLAAIVGVGAALLLFDGLWGIVALFGAFAVTASLWLALRRATSLVTEAPDEVLDELHIRLRNSYYREAYQIFCSRAALSVAVLLFASNVPGVVEAVFFTLICFATFLPIVVAAFRMPDVDAGD